MSGPTISLGLGCRGLKDKDFLSVSDPYVTVSRPDASGGFTVLRTSETKKNTLNPDWNDFLFVEKELNGNDKELNLRLVSHFHAHIPNDGFWKGFKFLMMMARKDRTGKTNFLEVASSV